jgi:hypothetical protein
LDLSIAFHLIPHILFQILSGFELSGGYLTWLRGCLTNKQSQVHASDKLSSPLEIVFGVRQGSSGASVFQLMYECLI